MKVAIRDVTGEVNFAEIEAAQIEDVQSRVLIQGVRVESGEWIAPQAIVGIKMSAFQGETLVPTVPAGEQHG